MSTALAIAGVTHVLKDLLNNTLIDQNVTAVTGINVKVTALPPDRIDATETNDQSQLNLYMYQATHNQGWRNQGLPSHNSGGERINNVPLALDLHCLLTAYGLEELHTEILLGYGMQLFHETPVLPRETIRTSFLNLPASFRAIAESELAEQIEQIKITPELMNAEEMSRLWAAFGAKYRPTAAYKVTVVLIESRKSTRSALPVLDRKVYVLPFQEPVIEKIMSQETAGGPIIENQKILSGHNIVIVGKQLRSDDVIVKIDGFEKTPATGNVSDTQIILPVPPSAHAGVHTVQVVIKVLTGSPTRHLGVSSNTKTFVLHPGILSIDVRNITGSGNDPRSADIELTVEPAIGETQRVNLLMNELVTASVAPVSYSFHHTIEPGNPQASINKIVIPIKGVKAGTYLIRIQVDGAESKTKVDLSGNYNDPKAII